MVHLWWIIPKNAKNHVHCFDLLRKNFQSIRISKKKHRTFLTFFVSCPKSCMKSTFFMCFSWFFHPKVENLRQIFTAAFPEDFPLRRSPSWCWTAAQGDGTLESSRYWLKSMVDSWYMAVCQNRVPLVNIKIAGKWMFIPLKMVLIGIDPYPHVDKCWYMLIPYSTGNWVILLNPKAAKINYRTIV